MFSPEKRKAMMSLIKSKDTKCELIVFRHLRKSGIYFQKHYSRVVGSPDVALPRKKIAVFIDGDFWHGRKYHETIDRLPEGFWKEKIARNVARDKKYRAALKAKGWKILQVWESDITRKRTQQEELNKIAEFLTAQ